MLKFGTQPQIRTAECLDVNLSPYKDWNLMVNHGPNGNMNGVIKWSEYRISTTRLLLLQSLLLAWWKPEIINGEMTISSSEYRQRNSLMRLFMLIDRFYPTKDIFDINENEWRYIFEANLFFTWGIEECEPHRHTLKPIEEPLAKQTYERCIAITRMWCESYQHGYVSDGPEYMFKHDNIEKHLRTVFRDRELDFDEWKKGGSFGAVPFTIAHLLLADALKTLKSKRTKMVLAYFETTRKLGNKELLKLFWESTKSTQIGAYRLSGDISLLSQTIEGRSKNSNANIIKLDFITLLHERLNSLHPEGSLDTFPWPSYRQLQNDYNNIQAAIYIIFLSVMGKRGPSEVLTLRGIDISKADQATGKNATMNPSIWKTNKGYRSTQGVTNCVDEAFDILLILGYQNKSNTQLPLFSALPPLTNINKNIDSLSLDRASTRLTNYYDDFCKRMDNTVSFNVKDVHGKITSHQFRHSFAEFAIRRFDGNVLELIRQHFFHSPNHWWSKTYTGDKLDDKHINDLNRRYIRELVPRVLRDNVKDPDFVGAMALYIKKQFENTAVILQPENIEEYMDDFCNDFIQLTAHEYGWCMLHKNFYNSAKCCDANGRPNPAATSVAQCNTCPNFCSSRDSHLTKQTQITFTHIDFIEQGTLSMPSLVELSRQAVRNAQNIFPELRQYELKV